MLASTAYHLLYVPFTLSIAYVEARFRVITLYADLQEIVGFSGDIYFAVNGMFPLGIV